MLIKCPECDLQVSDKALTCPHCGFPLVSTTTIQKSRNTNKRRRLPNGFGQISEMKGHNIRNKYRAMVTVGKQPDGRPIVKPLKPQSHFATYNDAYIALVEYHRNPYDLDREGLTTLDLYNIWSPKYFETLKSNSGNRNISSAWNYCSTVYNIRVRDLRARHIKGCIEEGTAIIKGETVKASAGTKTRIKSLFNMMLDFALEYELVDKNYARTFNLSDDVIKEVKEGTKGHIIFSDEEMNILWDNVDKRKYVDVLLIQCYAGWRPQELGLIELKNVDLENWTFVGGIKTEAGEDRLVPIHSRIRDLVKAKYDEAVALNSQYLLNCTDTVTHRSSIKLTYDKYQKRFKKIVSDLNLNPEHRAHDGRKHFVTKAKKYEMDEYAIKYIVGHEIDDITERVYTDREVAWLKEEIEKIK